MNVMEQTRTKLLNTAHTCDHFGIGRSTLYRWLAEGAPSHQPSGRKGNRYFDPEEITEWIKNRCFDRAAGQAA